MTETLDVLASMEGGMTVDFLAIDARLPTSRSEEDRKKRMELFTEFDPNGNGYLSLAELDKGCRDVLCLNEVFDAKPVIMRAYQAARAARKSHGHNAKFGDDYVERSEFRLFLVYIREYFEIWKIFDVVDTANDRRIDFQEFQAAAPQLHKWGMKSDNLEDTFREIDTNGGGEILFDEFCEWALAQRLDMEQYDGDDSKTVPTEPAPEPEVPAEPTAEVEVAAEPVAEAEPAPEPEVAAEAEPAPEPEVAAGPVAEAEAAAETRKAEPEAVAEAEPATGPEVAAEPTAEAEPVVPLESALCQSAERPEKSPKLDHTPHPPPPRQQSTQPVEKTEEVSATQEPRVGTSSAGSAEDDSSDVQQINAGARSKQPKLTPYPPPRMPQQHKPVSGANSRLYSAEDGSALDKLETDLRARRLAEKQRRDAQQRRHDQVQRLVEARQAEIEREKNARKEQEKQMKEADRQRRQQLKDDIERCRLARMRGLKVDGDVVGGKKRLDIVMKERFEKQQQEEIRRYKEALRKKHEAFQTGPEFYRKLREHEAEIEAQQKNYTPRHGGHAKEVLPVDIPQTRAQEKIQQEERERKAIQEEREAEERRRRETQTNYVQNLRHKAKNLKQKPFVPPEQPHVERRKSLGAQDIQRAGNENMQAVRNMIKPGRRGSDNETEEQVYQRQLQNIGNNYMEEMRKLPKRRGEGRKAASEAEYVEELVRLREKAKAAERRQRHQQDGDGLSDAVEAKAELLERLDA